MAPNSSKMTDHVQKWEHFVTWNLTLSALQTNTDTFANSADPDETARIEPSHQDLHCLPFSYLLFD